MEEATATLEVSEEVPSANIQESTAGNTTTRRASSAAWMPDLSDVRQAHLAQADALETVVSALASKHQSSIEALRRQVEAIVAWQLEVEAQGGPKVGQGSSVTNAGLSRRRYEQQEVYREMHGEGEKQGGLGGDARQSWTKGEQGGVYADAERGYNNQLTEEQRRGQDIAGTAVGGYSNQPTNDDEQSRSQVSGRGAEGGDNSTIDGQSQASGGQGTADVTRDNYRPNYRQSQAKGEHGINDAAGGVGYSQQNQASGEHGGKIYQPNDDSYQPIVDGQSQPRGGQGNFQPIDVQGLARGEQGSADDTGYHRYASINQQSQSRREQQEVAGVAEGNYKPSNGRGQTRGEQGSPPRPIHGQSHAREKSNDNITGGHDTGPIHWQNQAREGGKKESIL